MKSKLLLLLTLCAATLAALTGSASGANVYFVDETNANKIQQINCSTGGTPSDFLTMSNSQGSDGATLAGYYHAANGGWLFYGDGNTIKRVKFDGTSGGTVISSAINTANSGAIWGDDLYLTAQDQIYKVTSAWNAASAAGVGWTGSSWPISGGAPARIAVRGGSVYLSQYSSALGPVFTTNPNPPTGAFTATAVTGAPAYGQTGIASGTGELFTWNQPVQYGETVLAKFDGMSWTSSYSKLPNKPANDNADGSGFLGTTQRMQSGPLAVAQWSSGAQLYAASPSGGNGRSYLLAYSPQSSSLAVVADLTGSNYVRSLAVDPTCVFNPALVQPSLKSWEAADAPTISPTLSTYSNWTADTAYTVSPGNWTQGTSANTYAYEWQTGTSCNYGTTVWSAASGGTTATYTPTSADAAANKCLRVKITPTSSDGTVGFPVYVGGYQKSIAAGVPTNTTPPTVSLSGCTATLDSSGTWTGSPTFLYSWRRYSSLANANADTSGTPGSSSTMTLTMDSNYNGTYVRGFVRGSNGGGANTVGSSNVLGPISGCTGGGGGSVISATARPVVTQTGCELSVSNGTWSSPVTSYAYRWQRYSSPTGGLPDSGTPATTQTYTPTDADIGKYFAPAVLVTGPGGSGSSAAARYGPITACSSSSTTASSSTSKPTPGPSLKIAEIPKEITVDIVLPPAGANGSVPQEITAEVPCAAPEGELLDRCTVNMTAPEAVLLGQGDGIRVRADKTVSIGRATVTAKSGKKVIVVKVKINPTGRKALRINTKITATIGLTAVTVSNQSSTGSTSSEMRLPTQLLSPEKGIFNSNSIELNKAGVAFVKRLADLLPAKPAKMVFIGFADNTGVPGDNRWLGDRRAKAVRAALAARGVEATKSVIETKAATSPRADNAKAAGRERNRRVSIRITY